MKIGVLGGGQLGRMLALAGYPLGLRFRFMDPSAAAPAGHLAELVGGSFDDLEALDVFAEGLDLVTYEFENVPVASAKYLQKKVPVWPPPEALEASQDRLTEKSFFHALGIPTAPFRAVDSRAGLERALQELGYPAVLKTRRLGYDGKGQYVLRDAAQLNSVWGAVVGRELILEGFVKFDRELSILSARQNHIGTKVYYPLVENRHSDGILRVSRAPAPGLTPARQAEAEALAAKVLEKLNYAGVLAIEMFEVDGKLVVNEMAPRVHNSGHWTIEGAETSQFENHLRGILGWNLGPAHALGHAAMLNFIGAAPSPTEALLHHGSHPHWYGKNPLPGRKLGHVTLRDDDPKQLEQALAKMANLPGVIL